MKTKIILFVLGIVTIIGVGTLLWRQSPEQKDRAIQENRKTIPTENQKITLEIFHNPVTVTAQSGEAKEATDGTELSQGDSISTGEDGRAQVVYPNGTVTRLDKNTTVVLKTAEVSPQRILIQVKDGQIWSRIAELLSDEAYKTTSDNVLASVKGTSYGHSVLPNDTDQIITTKGVVEGTCLNNAKEGKVTKNYKMIFTCKGAGDESPSEITDKDKDEWYAFNNDEDNSLNKRFGAFVYKDAGDVLGTSDIASTIRDAAETIATASINPTNTPIPTSSAGTNPTNTPVPNTPVPGNTGVPQNTPVPTVTPTPTSKPLALGYIKPLPNSTFGGTVTSNGTPVPATNGMPIYAGDAVQTGTDTRVQVVMPPNSSTTCPDNPGSNIPECTYTRLDTNTTVQVNSNTTVSAYNADVVVEVGKIWNRIKKLTGQESYDTQTGDQDGLVATVRGTSYGHTVASESGVLTDRLFTIEGLVEAKCKKNPGNVFNVGPNTKKKIQCSTILDFIEQLSTMSQSDIDWLVYNTQLDLPGQIEGNTAPQVVITDPIPASGATQVTLANNVDTVNLKATVTDDGFPFGDVGMLWTINGIPCTICQKPFSEDTKVVFPFSGIYKLKLVATDGVSTGSDEVTIAVSILKDNKPPVPDAGDDKTITLPAKAVLNGVVVDDGVPFGNVIVNWWTLVKGPASVSFSPSAFNAKVTATFTKAGVYTLRLNSFDGDKQTFNDVVVTVLAAPTPTPSPSATPTPTVLITPTPSPTSIPYPDIESISRLTYACFGTNCNTTIKLQGTNIDMISSLQGIASSTYNSSIVSKTSTSVTTNFLPIPKNKTYDIKVKVNDGSSFIAPYTFNTNP